MQNCYSPEQNERLTTKHIHTLKFLQEIVSENKTLKESIEKLENNACECPNTDELIADHQARIKEIQEKCMARADEINLLLTDKHKAEMMKKVEDQLLADNAWKKEKDKLQAENDTQKREIIELRRQLSFAQEQKGDVQIYELKVAALEQEIIRLQDERKKLTASSKLHSDQLRKLEFYEDQNRGLKDELSGTNQKVKELEFKIRKLEKDMGDQGIAEQDEIMAAMKRKLEKMHRDEKRATERENNLLNTVEDLKDENSKLRRALDDSERMRMEIRSQMEQLVAELNLLKKQFSLDKDRQTFKDFIQVKRELSQLKEENEELRIRLKFSGTKRERVLPSIGSGGTSHPRVGSAKGDRRKRDTPPF